MKNKIFNCWNEIHEARIWVKNSSTWNMIPNKGNWVSGEKEEIGI